MGSTLVDNKQLNYKTAFYIILKLLIKHFYDNLVPIIISVFGNHFMRNSALSMLIVYMFPSVF